MNDPSSISSVTSPKKVLFLQTMITDYRHRFFLELCKKFLDTGTDYEVITGTSYFYDELKNGNEGLPNTSTLRNLMFFGKRVMIQLIPLRKVISAQLVFFEFNPRILSTWVFLSIRCALGKRSVGWGHYFSRKGEGWANNLIRKTLFRMISEFVTYSERDLKIIQGEFPKKHVKVAFNSTSSKYDFETPVPLLNCRDIIYTGRLIKEKKLDLLLRCVPALIQSLDDFGKIHIVGSGPDEKRLKSLVESLGIDRWVVFHGHNSSRRFLFELYSKSFCSVSPGYVGLMAFQSLAYGRPIIVSPGEPNSPEFHMCKEGENAVFFDSDVEKSLTYAILEIHRKRSYWNDLSGKIQTDCLARYSIEAMVTPFIEFTKNSNPSHQL